MAVPVWCKKYLRMSTEVTQIYNDLEELQLFCRQYGYPFNEADLYRKDGVWGLMLRVQSGRNVRNQWSEELKRLAIVNEQV
jgi:hypothetical protein